MVTAQSIGGIVGGMLLPKVNHVVPTVWLITLSAWGLGLCMAATVYFAVLPLVLIPVALNGFPAVGFHVTVSTLVQGGVPDHYRGRVLGAFSTSQSTLLLLGMGLASIGTDALGPVVMLTIVAGLAVLAGSVAKLMLRSDVTYTTASIERV